MLAMTKETGLLRRLAMTKGNWIASRARNDKGNWIASQARNDKRIAMTKRPQESLLSPHSAVIHFSLIFYFFNFN